MTDVDLLLRDQAGRLFDSLKMHEGAPFDEQWLAIEAMGLDRLLLPEQEEGFGGNWSQVVLVVEECARRGLMLPLGDVIASRWILHRTGSAQLSGPGVIAARFSGEWSDGSLSGRASHIPFGCNADWLVIPTDHSFYIVKTDELVPVACDSQGEAKISYDLREVVPLARLGDDRSLDIQPLLALLRLGEMSGAMAAALSLTIAHISTRQQFGRPLGAFQAIQQQIAFMASQAAAADCAIRSAALRASLHGIPASAWAIGAAKLSANSAAGHVHAISHQMHGAVGFTRDHSLRIHTRRLLALRSEAGNDAFWSARLGREVASLGGEGLWPMLVRV